MLEAPLALWASSLWLGGRLARWVGLSSLASEVCLGALWNSLSLGSELTPDVKATLELIGHIGLGFLMFESGAHLNLAGLRETGPRAVLAAGIGAALSYTSALLIGYAYLHEWHWLGAFTVVPSSIGVSAELLSRHRKLDSFYGQVIVTAAFLDDLVAIVLLAITTTTQELWVVLVGIGTTLGGSILLAFVAEAVLDGISKRLRWCRRAIRQSSERTAKTQLSDQVLLVAIFTTLMGWSWIGEQFGSVLLGQFCAGVVFSRVDAVRRCWRHQVKRIQRWLMRCFFGATVGFVVPFDHLFRTDAIILGAMIATASGVLSKLFAGLALPKHWDIVGAALVARGEFSFVALERLKITDPTLQGAAIWTVLLTMVVAPPLLRNRLRAQKSNCPVNETSYTVRIEGLPHKTLGSDVIEAFKELSMNVVASKTLDEAGVVRQELVVQRKECPIDIGDIEAHLVRELGNTEQTVAVKERKNNLW